MKNPIIIKAIKDYGKLRDLATLVFFAFISLMVYIESGPFTAIAIILLVINSLLDDIVDRIRADVARNTQEALLLLSRKL